MADIQVTVESVKSDYAYGERLELKIEVENVATTDLYIVEPQRGFVQPQMTTQGNIDCLVGLPELPYLSTYYGFELPILTLLSPNTRIKLLKTIALPLRDSFIGTDGIYHERLVPLSGSVSINIVVGYVPGFPVFTSDDPWGEFLDLQQLSDLSAVNVNVGAPSPGPP